MIELNNIIKSYPDAERPVLRDLNLVVGEGDWLMVTGTSGVGKTTLLLILGLLDPADSGDYILNGRIIARGGRHSVSAKELAELRRREIGILYQDAPLLPYLNTADNIALPHRLLHGNRRAGLNKAREICMGLGIESLLSRMPAGLSGGEKQRVALARALVNDPRILLADEPTGNLDGASSRALMDQLQAFRERGRTIIMVTHDTALAARGNVKLNLEKSELRRNHG